jgi:hypothetical protein
MLADRRAIGVAYRVVEPGRMNAHGDGVEPPIGVDSYELDSRDASILSNVSRWSPWPRRVM